MRKTKGKFIIAAGVLMLLIAAGLIIYNTAQDKKSGEAANEVLLQLENEISAAAENQPATEAVQPETEVPVENLFEKYEPPTEPTTVPEKLAEIDGSTYAGIITIPKLDIKLPVMSDWSYSNLKISPCRYSGKAAEGNMVIAAHNYSSHFGRISELLGGDEILFTAVDGTEYRYEVVQTETLNGTDVEGLLKNDEGLWDLTLFTCTLSGQSRVCVRADIIE